MVRRTAAAVICVGRKFEHLAQQSRRQRRNRVDAQGRGAWPADHLVGDADEPFLLAAEKQAEQRQLPQQIVGTVERNKRAAQMDVVMGVIDHAVDRAAEHRPAHDAVAKRDTAGHAGEVDAHVGEIDGVAVAVFAVVDRALQLGFVVNGEIAHVERALLGRIVAPTGASIASATCPPVMRE